MQGQKEHKSIWRKGYYRCRPSLYETVVANKYLADLDGTFVLFYSLSDYSLVKSIEALSKTDQFYAKLRVLNHQFIVLFGLNKFTVIDVEKLEIVIVVPVKNMLECVEARQNYIVALTSDEQSENNLIYVWKINEEGKIATEYEAIEALFPTFEDCTEQNINLAVILSIDGNPKVYVFWRNTNQMLEVDPIKRSVERYNRLKPMQFVTDIDSEIYAEISQNRITIQSKKGAKEVAFFYSENQVQRKLFIREGEAKEFYSLSDKGVSKWKLESDYQPVMFVESDKFPVTNLFFSGENVIGINTDKKYVINWSSPKGCMISNFPNEVVKKVLKLNATQACLLLEATDTHEINNQYHVEKYSKMEIYDFIKDADVAKKAVLKFQFRIDIESAVTSNDNIVRFILNEENQKEGIKKFIFRWSPFAEDKKKESKKREIIGAKQFDGIKLYRFDRILTFKKAVREAEMYDIFGKNSSPKSQVGLYDFGAKKIGEYELSVGVKQVEMSEYHRLYAIEKDKISIYSIEPSVKNRLQKIHELEMSVNNVYCIGRSLMMSKESTLLVYDEQFDLVMSEDIDKNQGNIRILPLSPKKFITVNRKESRLWDLEKEETKRLEIESCEPGLMELMDDNHIVIANKWIRILDFYSLK